MRVKETEVRAGFFWLPDKPDVRAAGTLTITDGGKIELETLDTSHALHSKTDRHRRVLGLVEEVSYITLEDCRVRSWKVGSTGLVKTKLDVGRAFFKIHLDDDENLTLKKLRFSIEGLAEWLSLAVVKADADPAGSAAQLTYTTPQAVVVDLQGMKVSFECGWRMSSGVTEGKISQQVSICIEADKLRPLEEFRKLAYRLTNFMCLAMDETVSITSFVGTVMAAEEGKSEQPTQTRIVYESLPFSDQPPKAERHSMLFDFERIEDTIGVTLGRWLAAYEAFEPTLSLYFAARSGAHKFINGKFLSLAQALETYHRRTSTETKEMHAAELATLSQELCSACPEDRREWLAQVLQRGNEVSFLRRIRSVINTFGAIVGSSDERAKLANQIATTRHYFTHYSEEKKQEAEKGQDLFVLSARMEAILQLVLLKELGFPEHDIGCIAQKNPLLRWKLEVGKDEKENLVQ